MRCFLLLRVGWNRKDFGVTAEVFRVLGEHNLYWGEDGSSYY